MGMGINLPFTISLHSHFTLIIYNTIIGIYSLREALEFCVGI